MFGFSFSMLALIVALLPSLSFAEFEIRERAAFDPNDETAYTLAGEGGASVFAVSSFSATTVHLPITTIVTEEGILKGQLTPINRFIVRLDAISVENGCEVKSGEAFGTRVRTNQKRVAATRLVHKNPSKAKPGAMIYQFEVNAGKPLPVFTIVPAVVSEKGPLVQCYLEVLYANSDADGLQATSAAFDRKSDRQLAQLAHDFSMSVTPQARNERKAKLEQAQTSVDELREKSLIELSAKQDLNAF